MKVVRESYGFCEEGLKRESLGGVFAELDGDGDGYVSDLDYLGWVNEVSRLSVG